MPVNLAIINDSWNPSPDSQPGGELAITSSPTTRASQQPPFNEAQVQGMSNQLLYWTKGFWSRNEAKEDSRNRPRGRSLMIRGASESTTWIQRMRFWSLLLFLGTSTGCSTVWLLLLLWCRRYERVEWTEEVRCCWLLALACRFVVSLSQLMIISRQVRLVDINTVLLIFGVTRRRVVVVVLRVPV